MIEILNPLMQEILAQRQAEEAKKLGEEEALLMLPDFKHFLGELIRGKLPLPVIHRRMAESALDGFNRGGNDSRYGVRLDAVFPLKGIDTSLTVYSTIYPEDPNVARIEDKDWQHVRAVIGSEQELDYKVDVDKLNRILLINGNGVIIESKKHNTKPFTSHTPIGSPLRSWPSWSHFAVGEEIKEYHDLLAGLIQRDDVRFSGTVPEIVIYDYSKVVPDLLGRGDRNSSLRAP